MNKMERELRRLFGESDIIYKAMYSGKTMIGSRVFQQVFLLLLCQGLPEFCEIRDIRLELSSETKTRTVRICYALGA